MKTNLLVRFIGISLAIVIAALCCWKFGLKGGPDLAGGTSLLYEVQIPDTYHDDPAQLVGQVIGTLKKRLDPNSQKNYTWRIVGGRRIQLQIPLASKDVRAARDEFKAAEEAVRSTALKQSDIAAVCSATGPARQTALDKIAPAGSPRRTVMERAAKAHDDLQAAEKQALDLTAQNKEVPTEVLAARRNAEKAYNEGVRELLATNVDMSKLKSLLDAAGGGDKAAEGQLKKLVTEYPAQRSQLEALLKANDRLAQFRGQNTDDPEDIKRLLQGAGKLDFRITVPPFDPIVPLARESLQEQGPRKAIVTAAASVRWFEIDRSGRDNFEGGYVTQDWGAHKYVLLYDDPSRALTHEKATWSLTRAYPTTGNTGNTEVGFEFDANGARLFGDLTRENVRKNMAILLDDRAISAPNINTPITGGRGVITFGSGKPGPAVQQEAKNLVDILNAGSLSAALSPEPISVREMSPQLGEDNIKAGFWSAVYALIAVMAFMVVYYTITGFFADVALLINLVLTLGTMAFMGATFTLPGIAGIVLTLGMAVDANVLINERIREEIHKGGTLWLAVKQGYDKVFWTIFDANLTTSLTSIVLIVVGSEEVRGFGITLLIGLAIHMFTALFVTRTLMIAAIRGGLLRQIDDHSVSEYFRELFTATWVRMGKWPFMRVIHVTNIDWIGKRHIFWSVSAVITVAGLVAFIMRGEDKYDTEFRGGTQVTFQTTKPMELHNVRTRIAEIGYDPQLLSKYPEFSALRDATVYGLGRNGDTFELATTIVDTSERKIKKVFLDALAAKFSDVMNATPTISIDGWPSDPAQRPPAKTKVNELQVQGQLVPVTKPDLRDNFDPEKVRGLPQRSVINYLGGVGLYVSGINPPQTLEQLTNRLRAEKQNLPKEIPYRNFDIIPVKTAPGEMAEEKDTRPLQSVVVVSADPAVQFDPKNRGAWDTVAEQEWNVFATALESRSPFQAVNSIDAVVAGQAKVQALLAIVISLVLIVIYVWIRFGGIRYGFGAILSLAHDAIMALAATVLAKYAAETVLGQKLLLMDFKINLTMIAAYLTVIGYSVNDTIVIFDRVRENRGRGQHPLDAKLVNDSINQCFGRTIWTTFTVFIVVLIMYIWGGEGVRGFSFAMLIGVFTGAYSTLAIASPMLLNVNEKTQRRKPNLAIVPEPVKPAGSVK